MQKPATYTRATTSIVRSVDSAAPATEQREVLWGKRHRLQIYVWRRRNGQEEGLATSLASQPWIRRYQTPADCVVFSDYILF